MGIFLKKRGEGYDPRWHGSWQVEGVRRIVALNLWRGTPPGPGEKEGDAKFERSRGEALRLFERARGEKKSAEEELVIAQKVHAARYGEKVTPVKIAELGARWDALPHKVGLSQGWRDLVHTVLSRFEAYMAANYPKVKECGALRAEHFKGFLDDVDKMGFSGRAWNYHLTILRGALRKVDGQGQGFRDYLAHLPKKAEATVHRRPFTGAELESVFSAAQAVDPELYPVIVAAACTALRRGDVATLEWESIDTGAGFVTVKTSKTGETVEIPIFPPFAAVLTDAERERHAGVPYVFPRVAAAYKAGPDSLDRRLRKVLAAAGFVTPDKVDAGEYPAPATPDEAVAKVNAGMVAGRWSDARRQKGLAILQRHLQGQNGRTIAAEMGIARGSVSAYLHEMENVGRVALVSPAAADAPRKATLAEMRDGEQRRNRGSLCGWHSFRTTFCTLALANGVPMEILRKITGHRTAEIVLKYYDRRGREALRKAIGDAMPKAIAGAVETSPADEDEGVEYVGFTPDKVELAKLLAEASPATLAKVAKLLKKGSTK